MLSSNKPHCHSRLPKPNLKILLMNWNILEKQLFQATSCSNHGHRIASSTKISNIFYRIKYDGQSCQPFAEKRLFLSTVFTKVACPQPKKRLRQRSFPVSSPNISEHCFLRNTLGWWLLLLNTIQFSYRVNLISKMLLSDLGYVLIIFKYHSKHCKSLINICFWKSRQLVELLLIN